MHEGGAWSVMQQRRWVSYIYRYREYVRCEIAGFIKVQRISNKDTDVTRIRMGMKMYKEYATCGKNYSTFRCTPSGYFPKAISQPSM